MWIYYNSRLAVKRSGQQLISTSKAQQNKQNDNKINIHLLSVALLWDSSTASLVHFSSASCLAVSLCLFLGDCCDHMNRFFHHKQSLIQWHPQPSREEYQISLTTVWDQNPLLYDDVCDVILKTKRRGLSDTKRESNANIIQYNTILYFTILHLRANTSSFPRIILWLV